MELREYITQTLTDIMGGILDAQAEYDHVSESGPLINPKGGYHPTEGVIAFEWTDKYSNPLVQMIDYEILVEVDKEKEGKSKLGVVTGILNVGGEGKVASRTGEANRLKFSVPVVFPQMG